MVMNISVQLSIDGQAGQIVMTETISLLTILSLTAICTTISLFFCGLPICFEIYRRKSTREISAFPFLMGFLGGSCWLRYGFLRADLTMISVNVVGVVLMFLYLIFYTYYSENRTSTLIKIGVVFAILFIILSAVEIFGVQIIDPLGFVCMTFNILNFGAPLAGVKVVFKKKCCDSLPLPLCVANMLVSSQWCLYGFLVDDIYIIIPNGAGVGLALLQISLFLVFPRKAGKKAPLSACFKCLNFELEDKPNSVDMEKAIAQAQWLKRNTPYQSSLPQFRKISRPKKNALTFIRPTDIFPSGSSNSSDATVVTVVPNWSLTPSVSHPELNSDFVQKQEENEEKESEPMFTRIQEIDDLDKQWIDMELKRVHSAPHMAESVANEIDLNLK